MAGTAGQQKSSREGAVTIDAVMRQKSHSGMLRDGRPSMTFHTLLGELDSLALRVQYFDRAASVVLHDQTYKLAQIGGMLLIIGIFVLQFFTFDIARADPIVPLLINGQPRSVAFIIGLALVIGIGVWLLMLVSACSPREAFGTLYSASARALSCVAVRALSARG